MAELEPETITLGTRGSVVVGHHGDLVALAITDRSELVELELDSIEAASVGRAIVERAVHVETRGRLGR